jgi:DNA segregation ATPase FtsK/SpoIIIE-like protein
MADNNIFKPLITGLAQCFDSLGNFVFRLVEGKPYTNEEDSEEIIRVSNIEKYKYIPLEDVICESKVNNIITYTYEEGNKNGVKAYVGYRLDKSLKTIDLLEGHIIVGGASRWGKSSFLNVFLTNIIRTYTPNEICLIGCDYKKSDVYYFRKYKHFRGMSTNKQEFLEQLRWLENKMQERASILDEANCRNVINYNKKHDVKMSYIVFVIDELIQVVIDKDCKDKLHTIMSKCASYGIYFILATQDCTKEVIGRCKMNCSQIIGFHTFDQTDSDTLIGKGYDLQEINAKGRCKIRNSEGIDETQIMYISEDEIEAVLKPYEREAKNI